MEKRGRVSKSILFVFLFFLIWSLLQFLTPLILPPDSVSNLSGLTVIADNNDITEIMPFPANIIYTIGDRFCHQQSDRSLFLNGNQMPFCSRCTAIWIGSTIALSIFCFFTVSLDERLILYLIFSLIPLGIDGIGQLFGLWDSTNIIRILTGLIAGIGFGMAIGVLINEIRSSVILITINRKK